MYVWKQDLTVSPDADIPTAVAEQIVLRIANREQPCRLGGEVRPEEAIGMPSAFACCLRGGATCFVEL